MLKASFILFNLILLTSCSIYSSAGRKQFEEKAPTSIQTFALQDCRELGAAETWLKEEFPSRSQELVEINADYEVWEKSLENDQVEVTVYSKNAPEISLKATEACVYKFASQPLWMAYKKSFLDELSHSPVNLDE